MNRIVAGIVLGYGLVLALLGVSLSLSSPQGAGLAFFTGVIGGVALLWLGALALVGRGRRGFTVLTLIPICLVLLFQAVNGWFGEGDFAGKPVPVGLITLMFVLSVAALITVAHAGAPRPSGIQKSERG